MKFLLLVSFVALPNCALAHSSQEICVKKVEEHYRKNMREAAGERNDQMRGALTQYAFTQKMEELQACSPSAKLEESYECSEESGCQNNRSENGASLDDL